MACDIQHKTHLLGGQKRSLAANFAAGIDRDFPWSYHGYITVIPTEAVVESGVSECHHRSKAAGPLIWHLPLAINGFRGEHRPPFIIQARALCYENPVQNMLTIFSAFTLPFK